MAAGGASHTNTEFFRLRTAIRTSSWRPATDCSALRPTWHR